MNNKELTPERQAEIRRLEQLSNSLIVITCSLGRLVERLIKEHKEANLKIEAIERNHWKHILDASNYFHRLARNSMDKEMYDKFNHAIIIVSFLYLELVAKCDDSDLRLWKFHNLLKTYPTVFKNLQPTIDDELNAFAELFGFNADGTSKV